MSNASTLLKRSVSLPAFRMDVLEATVKQLGKRAEKLGCAAPTYKVIREYTVDVSEDAAYPSLVAYCEVEVSYELIQVAGGWRFLASLETVDRVDGVARNRVNGPWLSDTVAREYVTAEQKCDHCGHNRKRNQTYIIQNEAGETKQIGSTCLQDYLGVDPAAAVAGLAFEAAIQSIGEDEESWGRSNAPRVWSVVEAVSAAVSLISHNGFVSAAQAEGGMVKTGCDMLTLLTKSNPRLADWYATMAPTSEHLEVATAIVEKLGSRILGDYVSNPQALDSFSFKLGIILHRGFAEYKDFQLLAAAVSREAAPKSEVKDEWLPGAVEGGKVSVKATISMVKGLETAFGSSLLVKFVTDEGYPVTTFYSGASESFTVGAMVTIKGTVKRLEVGKYGKQTLLTRVKVVA